MPRRPAQKSKRIAKKRQSGFSWKSLVKSSKTQKKIVRSASVVALFLLSVSFLGGIWLYKSLTKPFASAESSTSFDINNTDIVSLAIISVDDIKAKPVSTNSIHYLLFDKAQKKILTYEIGLDITTEVPGKFGEEPYSKVMPLGMMEDDNVTSGANLLVSSIKKDFAFNVDRYLVVEKDVVGSLMQTFVYGNGNGLLSFETLQDLALSVDTNITISEFYSLFTFARSLRQDRFVVSTNLENLDEVLKELTFDSAVSSEKASVGVLNGTNIPGVANYASRVIRNVGGHVISATNASKTYDESMLVVASEDLAVAKEIQKFFGISNVVLKGRSGLNEGISDRVDVTLVLGFDIAESL